MAEALGDVSLLRLRIFATVVDQGGYSAAARVLGLAQPTVSFHVRALERTCGCRLLVYRGRQVRATATGEVLYRLARRTGHDVAGVSAELAALHAGRTGRVRLGASIAFEQSFFVERVVVPFRAAWPEVELSLRFGTSRRMVAAVRAREVDLAYVLRQHVPADLRYTRLHPSRVVFLVAADHPLAAEPNPSAEAVGAVGLVTAPLEAAEWEYYDRALHDAGLDGYRVTLQVSGIQARLLAARAGLGVVAVFWPPFAPRLDGPDPVLPGLVPVALGATSPAGPEFGLVERVEAGVPPPVAHFATWLRHTVSSAA